MRKGFPYILVVVALVTGVVLGQAWAYAQNEKRLDMCKKYRMYCEENFNDK